MFLAQLRLEFKVRVAQQVVLLLQHLACVLRVLRSILIGARLPDLALRFVARLQEEEHDLVHLETLAVVLERIEVLQQVTFRVALLNADRRLERAARRSNAIAHVVHALVDGLLTRVDLVDGSGTDVVGVSEELLDGVEEVSKVLSVAQLLEHLSCAVEGSSLRL